MCGKNNQDLTISVELTCFQLNLNIPPPDFSCIKSQCPLLRQFSYASWELYFYPFTYTWFASNKNAGQSYTGEIKANIASKGTDNTAVVFLKTVIFPRFQATSNVQYCMKWQLLINGIVNH